MKSEQSLKALSLLRSALRVENNEARVEQLVKDAKKVGVRSEAIERALQRSRGRSSGDLQEVMYEGSLGGGVLLLIETLTDNTRRTARG